MRGLSAAEVIALLDLKPHPEGGYFRETFRDALQVSNSRTASTLIYFLLDRGQRSRWHRIDVVEVWHYYAGAPLELHVATQAAGPVTRSVLGADLAAGARPQVVIPAQAWQSAASLGAWTLAGCTVAPSFEFAGFETAREGWSPGL
jgi:predicted cupin superfamily sugar epimerase